MNIQKCDLSEGVNWLASGWKIFVPQWLMWIVLTLIFIGITLVCNLIPVVGALIYSAVTPALMAGIMWTAREVERGKDLDAVWLFEGLRDPEKRTPLLILGGLWLGLTVIATLLFFAIVGTSAMSIATSESIDAQISPQMVLSISLGALVTLAIQLVGVMALFYAVPLVMFDGLVPAAAIKTSFRACLTNFLPLLIYGLALLVLGVLAIVPFFLGLLVLLPLSFCANYCSYKSVFGK